LDTVVEDVLLDLLGGALPALLQLRVPADLGQLGRAIEGHPAHELRGDVVLRLSPRLPDALVGLLPHIRRTLRLRLDYRPQPPREALAAPGVEQDRVQRGAEDVVLSLVE